MTTQQASELWPIIKAFSEGKAVQGRAGLKNKWSDTVDPTFDPIFNWRIKPEPRAIWVNVYEDRPNDLSFAHNTKADARNQKSSVPYKTLKFIEAT